MVVTGMVFFKAHHIISDFIVIKNAISKRFAFYVYMVLVIKFNGERNKEKAHVCIQLFRDLCHHVPMFWEDENISGTYGESTLNSQCGRRTHAWAPVQYRMHTRTLLELVRLQPSLNRLAQHWKDKSLSSSELLCDAFWEYVIS